MPGPAVQTMRALLCRGTGVWASSAAAAIAASLALWVTLGSAHPIAASQALAPTNLEELLASAARYVVDFEAAFSRAVAEERYLQQVITTKTPKAVSGTMRDDVPERRIERRELRSDFLLVKLPEQNQWIPFRDVFEVDGRPVRDREARLLRLLVESPRDAFDQARQIVAESARYNLGDLTRTFNMPLLALAVLRADGQSRFRFSNLRLDPAVGPGLYSVAFQEQGGPTLVQGLDRRDLPARGRLWIEERSGRVYRSEIVIEHPLIVSRQTAVGVSGAHAPVVATVTTVFRDHPEFTVAVPVEMREEYRLPDWAGLQVTGVASYTQFRRFGVQVDEQVTLPK
ncbi:MAG: hypothetical protein ACRD3C_06040 [Vicinamibacterales bacterium]